jgi:hypothetical protein
LVDVEDVGQINPGLGPPDVLESPADQEDPGENKESAEDDFGERARHWAVGRRSGQLRRSFDTSIRGGYSPPELPRTGENKESSMNTKTNDDWERGVVPSGPSLM